MKTLFIGAGNMANAICSGIIKSNISCPSEIILYDKNPNQYSKFNENCIRASSLSSAVAEANYIFLSVKPQNLKEVLGEIKDLKINEKVFVTICAGIKMSSIEAILPGVKLIRVMPNTPLLIGRGASALCKNENATDTEFKHVEGIFASMGITTRVNESNMDAITALTGSSPAYVYMFIKALQDGALELGLDNPETINLICQTLIGSALMVQNGNLSIEDQIKMVKSPNGTTEKALNVLDNENFNQIIINAMKACADRAGELSNLF